jgi:transcriptional regulator with XRE-family HTH domain
VRKSIYTFPQQQLIILLRQVRREAGLTQMQLSERLGVLQSEVSNWERGEKRLDLIELCYVVDALGITLRDFIDRFEKLSGRQGI